MGRKVNLGPEEEDELAWSCISVLLVLIVLVLIVLGIALGAAIW